MLGISQTVRIDSIKQETVLDKEATIAQGNIARQRDKLLNVFQEQSILLDSVKKESLNYRNESDTLRNANSLLNLALEKEEELRLKDREISDQKILRMEDQLDSKKGNWFRGFLTGSGIVAVIFTALFLGGG